MEPHAIPPFTVTAIDHPSLDAAVDRFVAELRAETRYFGPRGVASRKPGPSLIRRLVERTPGVHLAAMAGDRMIGVARVDTARPEGPELLVAVVEDWRGRGVATALGAAVVTRAAERGTHRVLLRTSHRSPQVRALGAALGFDLVEVDGGRVDLIWRRTPAARSA